MLISAMWLLLLGAAIAALLMLRSMTAARELRLDDDRLSAEQADTDAVELIAADLVFDGPRSRWAQLPANGSLTLDGHTLAVTITAEDGLLDVNRAELPHIDGTLQDHHFSTAERARLLERMTAARAEHHKIGSFAELAAQGRDIVAPGTEDCLASALSPFGGINASMSGGTPRIGSVLRLTLGTGSARRIHALRLVAANDRPYALLDEIDDSCPTSAGTAS